MSRTGAPPPFEIGVGLGTDRPEDLRRVAEVGDRVGISFLSVGDNPGHLLETYVSLTLLAEATSRTRVGTAMTNPAARDPLVVASALSTLDRVAPGRVFLGIATGRARTSATAGVDELRRHLVALRELWAHGTTVHRGQRLDLSWDARPVPILVGAAGPRALALAGELADGVVVETGVSPEVVERATTAIAAGARAAGRDRRELETWWYLKSSLGSTPEEARARAQVGLAASAALSLGPDPAARGVPSRFHEHCRRAHAEYDMAAHVRAEGADPNRHLIADPDFQDYLLDRYGLVGTEAGWRQRIGDLRARGIDRVFCAAVVPDREAFVAGAGSVLAAVRGEAERADAPPEPRTGAGRRR